MSGPFQLDDRTFQLITKALSDPNRFSILQMIGSAKDTLACSNLRECVSISPATLSHHLKELEGAGLIRTERVGKFAHMEMRRDVWDAYLKRLSEI
jgi:ArsR family transcriptional regulator, arsenate/arsenite/antimonite-responsive transcriptional repressor